MKLFYSKGACSLGIRIILNELQLDFNTEAVDLKQKVTAHGEDFRQINPKGAVPALQLENGYLLTENSAILQYLADLYPQATLLPGAPQLKRYQALEWLSYISSELHTACSPLFKAGIPQEVKESFFKPALLQKLAYLNEKLHNKTYLLGSEFTVADSYLYVILSWLPKFKISLLDSFPNLQHFWSIMQERPAVKKSLEQEE